VGTGLKRRETAEGGERWRRGRVAGGLAAAAQAIFSGCSFAMGKKTSQGKKTVRYRRSGGILCKYCETI
jgi:hypothetical protein